jgi:hypothetical protein
MSSEHAIEQVPLAEIQEGDTIQDPKSGNWTTIVGTDSGTTSVTHRYSDGEQTVIEEYRVYYGDQGENSDSRFVKRRYDTLDTVSTLKCAGWIPHDGLFEWEWIASLEIERKSLRSNVFAHRHPRVSLPDAYRHQRIFIRTFVGPLVVEYGQRPAPLPSSGTALVS